MNENGQVQDQVFELVYAQVIIIMVAFVVVAGISPLEARRRLDVWYEVFR